MRRVALTFLRTSTGLLLPTLFLTACPGDDTSQTSSDTEGTSETSDSDSEDPTSNSNTIDPDTSTTVDPDTSSTMTMTMTTDPTESSSTDPEESSSTDPEESSSTDPEESSSSGMPELCGNGEIDEGEDCDGDNLGGADCIGEGFDAGVLACDACAFDTDACINFMCGNDAIEGKEICDGTDLAGADCVSEGFPLGGEISCDANCGDYDTSLCLLSVCGNDTVEDVEVCDGVDLDGQDCTTQGNFVGGTLGCIDDCGSFDTTQCLVEVCGDGIISGNEACDGNAFAPNACTDAGFVGGDPTCAADCQSASTISCFGEHIFCSNPNLAISAIGTPLVLTQQPVAGLAGQVVDLDVFLDISHTWVSDLDIFVQHLDNAVSTELSTDQCGSLDNINATYDQDALVFPDCVQPIAIEGTVLPEGNLDTLAGLIGTGNGNWQLSVQDQFNTDGGTINQWCLEITTGVPSGQQDFVFTGAEQQFVVPPGVTSVHIAASGAQGGDATNNVSFCGATDVPGLGGQAEGDLAVTPGEILTVNVGGAGGSGNAPGFNGGGGACNDATTCSSGGGASDVRQAGAGLGNRVIVAGGAGGAEWSCAPNGNSGAGGGLVGGNGLNGDNPPSDAFGGTQVGGGAGGIGGAAGAAGVGGSGAADCLHCGGGGGGFFGGGAGATDGHGGGGSAYIDGVANGVTNTGVQAGNGAVTISWG